MSGLRVSPDLVLPIEAVTEAFAILAVSGAGKSNAAVVFAEELYDNNLPWVAIDPKGDWWGVRSSADGKAAGLSVVVFGGEHADVPLEPTAGRYIAELIAEQRLTCVLDVSEMTKADQRRFLTDFAERLYRRNREPLMVFCEEADEYIPQQTRGDTAKVVGAMETLVKRGRFRGIGTCLITQRSASLNKDVLTQARNLFAMQTPSPQDRKAILDWISHNSSSRDVINELPELQPGEAWFFSPAWLRTLEKLTFRRRRTYDSGATPKVGEKRRPPARLADVDLAAIKEAMAETIERAKADDPRELRKRIAELEVKLRAPAPAPVVERVEISVFTEADQRALMAIAGELTTVHRQLEKANAGAEKLTVALATVLERTRLPAGAKEGTAPARGGTSTAAPAAVRTVPVQAGTPPMKRTPARTQPVSTEPGSAPLGKAEKALLTALAGYPDGKSRKTLAALAGLRPSGGHYGNVLSALRKAGRITGEGQGPYRITEQGMADLGDDWTPLPTGAALLTWWLEQFGRAHRDILQVLVDAYPNAVDRSDLAAAVNVDPSGGHYGNVLSALRTRDLITGTRELRADDDFMEAIR